MILANFSKEMALQKLAEADGFIRKALI